MTTLRNITEEHRALELMVEREELTADDVKDTFEALSGEFNNKVESLVFVINNMDTDVIDAEIKRLADRKKVISNKKQQLVDYLKFGMEAVGEKKITLPLFTVTLVNGRDIAVVDTEGAIDPKFTVEKPATYSIDKRALLAALKVGEVDGAHLEKTAKSIRIK